MTDRQSAVASAAVLPLAVVIELGPSRGRLLAYGPSNAELADELVGEPSTVKSHVAESGLIRPRERESSRSSKETTASRAQTDSVGLLSPRWQLPQLLPLATMMAVGAGRWAHPAKAHHFPSRARAWRCQRW